MLVDLRSGDEQALTDFGSEYTIRNFDISSDDREIVFDRVTEASDVILGELTFCIGRGGAAHLLASASANHDDSREPNRVVGQLLPFTVQRNPADLSSLLPQQASQRERISSSCPIQELR